MPDEIAAVMELCLSRRRDGPLDIPARRVAFDARPELGQVPGDIAVTPVQANGVRGEMLVPSGASSEHTLLYLHGGGYCWGSLDSHRPLVSMLAQACAARVLMVDYRLAPEHRFPAPLVDAANAYRWLLDAGCDPAKTALAGDSAGGGLTLALLAYLRDAGNPLPAGAVMISPWTDMTCSGGSYESRAEMDPICTRELLEQLAAFYLGDADPRDPRASPIFSDLSGLPPLLFQVGTAEILYDDSMRAAASAKDQGVDARVEASEHMVHVWHLFAPMLREGREGIARASEFIRECFEAARAGAQRRQQLE